MGDEMVEKLVEIALNVAEQMKYPFTSQEVIKVLKHTERKMELNGKGDDYLPLLFADELKDYVIRIAINVSGGFGYV